MSKFDNLKGQRFGRLIATEYVGKSKWLCKCDCGKETTVSQGSLKSGNSKSCGCLKLDMQTKHGCSKKDGSKERLYSVWQAMRERCNNPNASNYKIYGGRGIKVCDEWNEYPPFKEWALKHGYNPYAPKGVCTLDRIDVNGNYEPSNCRWADAHEQQRNRRTTLWCIVGDEKITFREFAERHGITYNALYRRVHRGKSIEQVVAEVERESREQTKEKA